MKLKDPHFNNVLQKKKIYEIRLYDEKRKNMNIVMIKELIFQLEVVLQEILFGILRKKKVTNGIG